MGFRDGHLRFKASMFKAPIFKASMFKAPRFKMLYDKLSKILSKIKNIATTFTLFLGLPNVKANHRSKSQVYG